MIRITSLDRSCRPAAAPPTQRLGNLPAHQFPSGSGYRLGGDAEMLKEPVGRCRCPEALHADEEALFTQPGDGLLEALARG